MIPTIKIGEQLICPVCNQEFKATSNTVYIVKGGYTCGLKCFLIRDKEWRENNPKIKKR